MHVLGFLDDFFNCVTALVSLTELHHGALSIVYTAILVVVHAAIVATQLSLVVHMAVVVSLYLAILVGCTSEA